MAAPVYVEGLRALADRYDGFIFDQWGVLHDGSEPYPGVLEVIGELGGRGKRLVMLSNSGRRAELNRARLAEMGFPLERFARVVTSGEATWQLMNDRAEPPFDRLGRHCLLLTIGGDRDIVEGLDLELVERVEDADFIFASGLDPGATVEGLEPLIATGLARDLPLVCSNPDIVAVTHWGMMTAPGALARAYAERGGDVALIGKPHRPIYGPCFEALEGIEAARIVAVGDSLEHDIKGANDAGIAAAFVMNGIHREDFPEDADERSRLASLERLEAVHGARPDWLLPRVVW